MRDQEQRAVRRVQFVIALVFGGFVGWATTGTALGSFYGACVALVGLPILDYWIGSL